MAEVSRTDNSVPWEIIENVLFKSFQTLVRIDSTLLEIGVNERSLTHRLAMHIQQHLRVHEQYFLDCDVDCEYNRSLDEIKRLASVAPGLVSPENVDAVTIYPDILIHRRIRQFRDNNILVIEVKKNYEPSALDIEKLSKLTKGQTKYEYQFGVFLGFDQDGIIRVIRFQSGQPNLDSHAGNLKKLLVSRDR